LIASRVVVVSSAIERWLLVAVGAQDRLSRSLSRPRKDDDDSARSRVRRRRHQDVDTDVWTTDDDWHGPLSSHVDLSPRHRAATAAFYTQTLAPYALGTMYFRFYG